ncbi:NCS2 family permease [Desulfoscipio gibsoniae]|uniref:Permease n=1 Tax=Desulfoscipio gibsoniae DSM 7213 TaxID=767817 RepID=R4KIH2_9FIRM|nr:NCS2 family permease [Desulfoscipio gibsoniae]AGL00335.1 permease [Desulfoscipio gibsoniae DSM 7213]
MLEKLFKLKEHDTNTRTEIIAGLTTFMTMAYILFLNPNILAATGMDKNAVFFATAVAAGVVTIAMGLLVNFPIALAPGMGLNAYFATVAAQHVGIPWPIALGAVFISGLLFIILTVTQIRQLLVVAIPQSMKNAIIVGIGLFITMLGLKMAEFMVIQAGPVIPPTLDALNEAGGVAALRSFEWNITLGSFGNNGTLLALIGLALSALLMAKKIKGAILFGILITTLIGLPMGVTSIPTGFQPFALPDFSTLAVGKLDLAGALEMGLWSIIFTFTFVELFDTFGTLVGTAGKAGLLDKNGQSPRLGRAMLVDACGVSFGALMGTSSVTAYVESTAGVAEGGRTGLTAVTTGVLFLLALVLAPLAGLIPGVATAPALIIVGLLMAQSMKNIDFIDFTEGLPAFLTIVLMPFTGSIANGIAAGIVFYTLLKAVSGRTREVHWLMWLLSILILARYLFLAGH